MIYRTQIFSDTELHFICDTNCGLYDKMTTRKVYTCVVLSLHVDRGVTVETGRSAGDVDIHTCHDWDVHQPSHWGFHS